MKKKIISMAGLLLLNVAPAWADTFKEAEISVPRVGENHEALHEHKHESVGNLDGLAGKLADRLKFSGLVEIEVAAHKDFLGAKTSDASLATVELGLDAKITELVGAHVLALYEEGAENDHIIIDEGTITLGDENQSPFYLAVGKMYVPFGSFKSSLVSDPLTLELAETRDTALLAGFAAAGWYGSLYTFNGEVDKTGGNDTMGTFGANLSYKLEDEKWQIDLGAGWLNNLGNSNTLRDHIATTSVSVAKFIESLALHGRLQYGGLSVMAEYVTALDFFQPGEMIFAGRGAKPKAWQLELAYTTEVADREVTLALGYQRTEETVVLGLPEHRYLGSICVGIFDKTTLALEYRHDQDYDIAQGGTDESAKQVVAQLAVAF
ncbi:MAG: hypothetical protein A2520_08905 [Deltaproteobacteria bacterium RIFOXYD12_FULL_53_23]|nr:MAG: hypothetical protein A2520_08905 [Deltaproteobacteria bacterium RIFOXYD12_FULL_53_23]